MSRNRLLVGGLVIVAALVIAYFAFVYPPVSKEDTSGAIGVANKYRNEQITDKDVMLKGQEDSGSGGVRADVSRGEGRDVRPDDERASGERVRDRTRRK